MDLRLEQFDPAEHNARDVARLIYLSDEQSYSLIFGDGPRATEILTRLLGMQRNFYSEGHVRCVMCADTLIGVVVSLNVEEKFALDKAAGRDLRRAMGLRTFLRRLPLLLRVSRITAGDMDADGHYILAVCIIPSLQSRGYGSCALQMIFREHDLLYLHVNKSNDPALRFYRREGFRIQSEHSAILGEKRVETYLLSKGGCANG